MVVLDEKSGEQQTQQASSSGDQEYLYQSDEDQSLSSSGNHEQWYLYEIKQQSVQ